MNRKKINIIQTSVVDVADWWVEEMAVEGARDKTLLYSPASLESFLKPKHNVILNF